MKNKKNKRKRKPENSIFNKMSDKTVKIIWGVLAVLFLLLLIRYERNKWFIKYYNLGKGFYLISEYELAESSFEDALYRNPKGKKDCNTRVNLALSMVKQVPPESVTKENFQECIDKLEEAKDLLLENGCAHDSDSNGHDKDAQTLKEEIDEYIKQLMEGSEDDENKDDPQNGSQGTGDDNKQGTGEGETEEVDQRLNDIMQQIENDQKRGQEERFRDEETFKNWGSFGGMSERNW